MHNLAVLDGNKDDCRAGHDCIQRDRCIGGLLPQARQRARAIVADELVLHRLRPLRLDRLWLGVRNETPEAGYHQRPLLCFPGAAANRDRRGVVPGVTELL